MTNPKTQNAGISAGAPVDLAGGREATNQNTKAGNESTTIDESLASKWTSGSHASMIYEIDTIPLDAVRIDGGTQSRAALNGATTSEYAEAIRGGAGLPPVIAFFDGVSFWLADGFHRYNAHRDAGAIEISAEIRTGTQRDAILFSVGANASHGLRRTNEDKRSAVMMLLTDPEWTTWSDNAIAKACSVSRSIVEVLRKPHLAETQDAAAPSTRTVQRSGSTYEQNTTNIGKAKPVTDPAPPAPAAETAPKQRAPAPQQAPQNMATASEVQALREQLAEIADNMKSTLADNVMMGRVFDADDRIKASMDEAIRQKAIADNAERTLAAKSGEFIERARAVMHWMNRAQKAEKALTKLGAAK